jgi:hypothetical protein
VHLDSRSLRGVEKSTPKLATHPTPKLATHPDPIKMPEKETPELEPHKMEKGKPVAESKRPKVVYIDVTDDEDKKGVKSLAATSVRWKRGRKLTRRRYVGFSDDSDEASIGMI